MIVLNLSYVPLVAQCHFYKAADFLRIVQESRVTCLITTAHCHFYFLRSLLSIFLVGFSLKNGICYVVFYSNLFIYVPFGLAHPTSANECCHSHFSLELSTSYKLLFKSAFNRNQMQDHSGKLISWAVPLIVILLEKLICSSRSRLEIIGESCLLLPGYW